MPSPVTAVLQEGNTVATSDDTGEAMSIEELVKKLPPAQLEETHEVAVTVSDISMEPSDGEHLFNTSYVS